MSPPRYFTQVQEGARNRWEQLEGDPGLAAPWHQLFRQIQSPRHVLSELLQNADDAKATWAKATINKNVFEFTHNGEDFNKQSFESLCQFGLSNKRHLHTIGFRGVGFKSVFSLGDKVEVKTPTLNFDFKKKRFTEPIWNSDEFTTGETIIRVKFHDELKANTLLNDFERWIRSPFPLLFFRAITRLDIQDRVLTKHILKDGPTANSKYIKIRSDVEREVLLIESSLEDFPADAVEEVKDERGSSEIDLPPCSVQIILDIEADADRLYTVLPTDVEPLVPFSMNGPFIQDPARKEIKHPANSPTNRWLLKRIGKLAATAMIGWLNNRAIDIETRAQAYDLFPEKLSSVRDLNEACTNIILEGFESSIEQDHNILLDHNGNLGSSHDVIALPEPILKTWSPELALSIFSPQQKSTLSAAVKEHNLQCMRKWGILSVIEKKDVIERLLDTNLPRPKRPKPFNRLVYLWAYLQPISGSYSYEYISIRSKIRSLAIVPVQNREEMYPADQTLVLGGKESDISEEDWNFLAAQVNIVSRKWGSILSVIRENNELENDEIALLIDAAKDLFNKLNLNQKVGMEQIVNMAGKKIFSFDDPGKDGIRIAHIAAFTDVRISDSFKFLCRDLTWKAASAGLFIMTDDLDRFLPTELLDSRALSDKYFKGLKSYDIKKFLSWAKESEKSRLHTFLLPSEKIKHCWSRADVVTFALKHGGKAPPGYPYSNSNFRIRDFNWEDELWSFWRGQAKQAPIYWADILKKVLYSFSNEWEHTTEATVHQIWGSNHRLVVTGNLNASWISQLQNFTCIPDTFGNLYLPSGLFRLTLDTQSLVNVEKFVHPDFDKPEHSKALDLLGVRSKPTGVQPLIERLKAMSESEKPPISHLVDLYRSIERVLLRIDTNETTKIKDLFTKANLVYSSEGTWESSGNVFLKNPDNIPGVRVIHPEIGNLSIWNHMEVRARPTMDTAIEWLQERSFWEKFNKMDLDRVNQILRSAPTRIWQTCKGWLNVKGVWTAADGLVYGAANVSTIAGLFDSFKEQTADLSMIDGQPGEIITCFGLISIDRKLAYRIVKKISVGNAKQKPWIAALGEVLARLKLLNESNDGNAASVPSTDKETSLRLCETQWQAVSDLTVAPYIDGQPVGVEKKCKIAWHSAIIYALGKSASHHRDLVEELSRHFQSSLIKKVISDCVDRDPEWIREYAEENLELISDLPETETRETEGIAEEPEEYIHETGTGEAEEDEQDDNTEVRHSKKRQNRLTEAFKEYIKTKGYAWSDQAVCFFHEDEKHKIMPSETPFHWVEQDSSGGELKRYWLSYGSKEKGIELPAEIWNLAQNENYDITLLLIDKSKIVAFPVSALKGMISRGDAEVYPAKLMMRIKDRVSIGERK